MRKRVWRLMKIHWKRLLTLRGDRRAIARGIALGVSINFIPTIGLGPPIVYWIARVIKGHRVSALVSTFGVKAAVPFLYVWNYIVGEFLLEQRISPNMSWNGVIDMGTSSLLGAAVNFTITFIITYYLALWWIERRRDNPLPQRYLEQGLKPKHNN